MANMTDINGTSAVPLADEFARLIERIEAEEHRSLQQITVSRQDGTDIELHHRLGVATHNTLASHADLQQLHSAMLKVHRKIRQRHQVALHQCRILRERCLTGQYTRSEMTDIATRLHELYQQIREENARIEEDRRKMMAEHQAFVASLGGPID